MLDSLFFLISRLNNLVIDLQILRSLCTSSHFRFFTWHFSSFNPELGTLELDTFNQCLGSRSAGSALFWLSGSWSAKKCGSTDQLIGVTVYTIHTYLYLSIYLFCWYINNWLQIQTLYLSVYLFFCFTFYLSLSFYIEIQNVKVKKNVLICIIHMYLWLNHKLPMELVNFRSDGILLIKVNC